MGGMPTSCDKPSFIYLLRQYHPDMATWSQLPDWTAWPKGYVPEYTLVSKGPYRQPTTFIYWIPYDPTNGTVSFGELINYGP
jgi:hypothetical protein